MPSQKNIDAVESLKNVISSYPDFFITENKGLSVADITELRRKLKEFGCIYQVVKNNIFKIALNNKGISELDAILTGPNAILFTKDVVAASKTLKEFLKDKTKAEKITLKAGYAEGRVVDVKYIEALAELPSKEQLLAKMLGTMKNPATRLVRVLKNPVQKLSFALKAIAEKKQ